VIAKESFPVMGRATTGTWEHIVGDGSLRKGDTKLEQLAVNSGSTSQQIGAIHFPNQSDDGWGDGFSTRFTRTAFPSPEGSKSGAMPSDDGAGLNEAEPEVPIIPDLGKPRPQSPVDESEPRSVGIPAQDQQLVAQSQVLEKQVAARFQSGHDQTDEDDKPMDHAAEDSGKCVGSPAFSDGTDFLPMTGVDPLRSDVRWLARATDAMLEHWRKKNARKTTKSEADAAPLLGPQS
jgi:hypothetical protein